MGYIRGRMGCGGSDESEHVNQSVVCAATDDVHHQTEGVFMEMAKDFGTKGVRGQKAVEKIFKFIESAEFATYLTKLLDHYLKETQHVGDDGQVYMLAQDEAEEWYSKVDSNNSGVIEKNEFYEVMKYFMVKAKLDTAMKMHAYLKNLPQYKDMNEFFRCGGDCTWGDGGEGFRLTADAHHQE